MVTICKAHTAALKRSNNDCGCELSQFARCIQQRRLIAVAAVGVNGHNLQGAYSKDFFPDTELNGVNGHNLQGAYSTLTSLKGH